MALEPPVLSAAESVLTPTKVLVPQLVAPAISAPASVPNVAAVLTTVYLTTAPAGGVAVASSPITFLTVLQAAEVAAGNVPHVRFWIYEPGDPSTTWTELTKVVSCTTQEDISNVGSIEIVVQNDSPELSLIDGEKLIGVEFYGTLRYAGVVGEQSQASISSDGAAGERTTFTMQGVGALLDEAVVAPYGGNTSGTGKAGIVPIEQVRRFDWTASDYLDFAWPDAVTMSQRLPHTIGPWTPPANWGRYAGEVWPLGMLWDNTEWIWARQGTQFNAPPGTCLFRSGYEVPAGVTHVVIMAAADNAMTFYHDGVPLFQDIAEFRTAQISDPIPVSTGTHLLAAEVTNYVGTYPNPGGFACEVHATNASGTLQPPETPEPNLLLHSDFDWRCLPYITGAYPGMPIGRIMRILLYEAIVFRGCFPFITVTFGDTTDSDGNAWPWVEEITTNTGRTILDFFRELSEVYIDFRLEPATLRLHAWNKGTMGQTRSVTLQGQTDPNSPASGSVVGLTHRKVW